jgi:hypothetical protein
MKQILPYKSGISYLLLIFLVVFSTQVQATDIKGSDLTYTPTSTPNEYLVKLKIYGDCSSTPICVGCPGGLSTNCAKLVEVYGTDGLWANMPIGTVTLNIVRSSNESAFDLIQLCSLAKSVCSNCGTRTPGTFMPGVEVYTFQGFLNLSGLSPGCCNVELRFQNTGRSIGSSVLNNPSTLYCNVALLNRCLTVPNNSIVYNEPPVFALCNNVYQTISSGVSDPDGDSLSFHLGSALNNFNLPATYFSPYSPSVPFPYFGMPVQSPPAQAPLGIQFNKYSGALSFQPLGVFVADVIMETKEWRKINGVSSVIATNRRDYQIVVQNCASNPIIPVKKYNANGVQVGVMNNDNFDSINVCEGTPYCRTYVAVGDAADTTIFNWSIPTNMPGASITRMYDSATRHLNGPRNDSIQFCWTAPIGSASNRPYILNFVGRDNACPIPVFARKSIGVFVNKQPLVTIQKQLLGHYAYRFSYALDPSSSPVNLPATRWYIEKWPGSNVYDTLTANTISNHYFGSIGKYKVFLNVSGYGSCNGNLLSDSVSIDFIDLALVMRKNISCKGESTGEIKVQTVGGTSPFQYKLNDGNWASTNEFSGLQAGNYKVFVRDSINRLDSVELSLTQPANTFTSTLSTVNPTCSYEFGSAQITANGGDMPYQYSVDSGVYGNNFTFAGLISKAYTFQVVDANGCLKSMPASINIPSKMAMSSLVKNNICYQNQLGSVTFNVTGATAPYTYRLAAGAIQTNPVFDSLPTGTHKFYVIDSKNCKDSVSIQIASPNLLSTTMSKTNATCLGAYNGTALVATNGGTPPYRYVWRNAPSQNNPFANNLGAGYAHVTISDDNGCMKEDSILIGYTATFNGDEICAVTTDTLTGMHKVIWKKTPNTGIVNYRVFGSSNASGPLVQIGMVPYDSAALFINTNPLHFNNVWNYKIRMVDSCGNMSAGSLVQSNLFLEINGTNELNWNNISSIAGATNIRVWRSINYGAFTQIASFSPSKTSYQDLTASGMVRRYYLEVDLMPNCLSNVGGVQHKFLSNIQTVNLTGLTESMLQNPFQIYPNPSNGKVQIGSDRNDLNIALVEVYNVQGDKVKMISCEAHTRRLDLDLTELAEGVYQIVIVSTDNARHTSKLVLNR